jgi:hypothetical protein
MEIILAIIVVGLLIAGMAIGVLMGRPPITGSCGGVGRALGESDYTCEICGDDPNKCDEQSGAPALGYDASGR